MENIFARSIKISNVHDWLVSQENETQTSSFWQKYMPESKHIQAPAQSSITSSAAICKHKFWSVPTKGLLHRHNAVVSPLQRRCQVVWTGIVTNKHASVWNLSAYATKSCAEHCIFFAVAWAQ